MNIKINKKKERGILSMREREHSRVRLKNCYTKMNERENYENIWGTLCEEE